jgi:hypothetical protein
MQQAVADVSNLPAELLKKAVEINRATAAKESGN